MFDLSGILHHGGHSEGSRGIARTFGPGGIAPLDVCLRRAQRRPATAQRQVGSAYDYANSFDFSQKPLRGATVVTQPGSPQEDPRVASPSSSSRMTRRS